jgi:hypothetical protein
MVLAGIKDFWACGDVDGTLVRSVRTGYYLEAEKKEGTNTTGANTLKDFIKARTAIRAVMPRMRGCGGAAPSRPMWSVWFPSTASSVGLCMARDYENGVGCS